MIFDDVIDKVIKEDDVNLPSLNEIEEFERTRVWSWIKDILILEQRQLIMEVMNGKAVGGEENLDLPSIRFRQGLYHANEKILNLLDITKDEIKLMQRTKKQTKED